MLEFRLPRASPIDVNAVDTVWLPPVIGLIFVRVYCGPVTAPVVASMLAPPPKALMTGFNCATVVASCSAVPAETLTSWRVESTFPIDTLFILSATESAPRAIELTALATAFVPMAKTLAMLAALFNPIAMAPSDADFAFVPMAMESIPEALVFIVVSCTGSSVSPILGLEPKAIARSPLAIEDVPIAVESIPVAPDKLPIALLLTPAAALQEPILTACWPLYAADPIPTEARPAALAYAPMATAPTAAEAEEPTDVPPELA